MSLCAQAPAIGATAAGNNGPFAAGFPELPEPLPRQVLYSRELENLTSLRVTASDGSFLIPAASRVQLTIL